MLENADGRELESNYPGVIAAMWAAAAPEVEKQTEAELPAFWAKLADLYASRMTVAEIVAASSFFGSATGRKLIRLMNEGLASQASTAASSIQDGTFTPADHERLKAAAAASLAGGFSSSEEAAVEEFTQSSAGRKMLSLKEQVNALTSEWLNTANPKGEARIDALIQKAVDDFIASRKPRKGKGAR
jgi:hypothetical protein